MNLNVDKFYWQELFLENLNYPDSHTTNRIKCFSSQNSSLNLRFLTEFMMDEFEHVAEEYKFEKKNELKKVALFRNFELSKHWCKEHKSAFLPLSHRKIFYK